MKRLITICLVVGMVLAAGTNRAHAVVSVNLSGTFSGTDVDTTLNNGEGSYYYNIDLGTVFFVSAGTVTVDGIVNVSGLAPGSFLQIGLIDKEQSDLSRTGFLDTTDIFGPLGITPSAAYQFNNSAIATFYSDNTANLIDQISDAGGPSQSSKLTNPGATSGVFDFTLDILNDGTMELTLHGSDVSTTWTYGTRNWWDTSGIWSGGELDNGAYLIAQMFVDTGDTVNSVSANYDITGVPEPATIALLGLGGLFLRRKRRA